ncbi:ribonuclease VapC [Spirochaetia bacterium]|nr:ribonuclease VapC [Spirochaetia bacterium]
MTTFALDTNIVSYLLKNDKKVTNKQKTELKAGNTVVIPPIVYYEIRRGLISSSATTKSASFSKLFKTCGIKKIDLDTLETAANLYAKLKAIGLLIEDSDLLIAAHCIRHGFTLVTNNTDHFKNIDNLNLADWTI